MNYPHLSHHNAAVWREGYAYGWAAHERSCHTPAPSKYRILRLIRAWRTP